MKDKVAILAGAAALGCLALVGCGGGNENPAAPPAASNPPTPTKQLDTAEVLAIVQTNTSDTSQPFVVNGGAVMVTPVNDETGELITVDGT
jgi:hypothetical protein